MTSSRKRCPRTSLGKPYSSPTHRFAVYDLEYKTADGRLESKIVFILYCPDICDSRLKFTYTASKDSFKKSVQPNHKEAQVNDWADLEEERFIGYFKH